MNNQVTFPGLGLEFNISPIAFSINGINIHWYAIFIILGIVIALIGSIAQCKKYKVKSEDILTLFLITLPIALICARTYFIIFELEYYIHNPSEIFNIRSGGLAIYGGIIGGVVTIWGYCKIKKIKLLDMLDLFVPFLALAQSLGRWGNFFNIEAYGSQTQNILRMGIIESGKYIEVHPTFLYESIVTMIIFILLMIKRKTRKFSGELTCIYIIIYGIARAIIEGFRTDSLMIGNIRISQILSIILVIVTITILSYNKIKNREKTVEEKE